MSPHLYLEHVRGGVQCHFVLFQGKMGGWKLEAGRFTILVGLPVAAFWAFNQPNVFSYFVSAPHLCINVNTYCL